MVTERLADTAEAFAADRNDRHVKLLAHLLGYCFDVVANQTDWTFGLNGNPFCQWEHFLNFTADDFQLLVAAEDDVLLGEITGNLHSGEVVDAERAVRIVAACAPAVLSAADRAVGDVNHVLDRAPYYAFRTGIGAAAWRHYARTGFNVRFQGAAAAFFRFLGVNLKVLFAILPCFIGIGFQNLFN
ncbi:hypothetical protein D3C71_1427230 [compost metagenome]